MIPSSHALQVELNNKQISEVRLLSLIMDFSIKLCVSYIYSAEGQLGSHLFFLSWWKFSFLHFGKWFPKGLDPLCVDCPQSEVFPSEQKDVALFSWRLIRQHLNSKLFFLLICNKHQVKSMSTSYHSSTNWHNETQYRNQMNRRISLRRSKSILCLE